MPIQPRPRLPLVYIAGPYTFPDPIENLHRAVQTAEVIESYKCAVIIPHLSMAWHMARPAPVEVWYARDIEVLLNCDALVRFSGRSVGADAEVEQARANGIRTFTFDDLGMTAFKNWRKAQ